MKHKETYLLGLVVFAAYLATSARQIVFGDSGELAAAAYLFGVAHSTGYPLYVMLGKLFTFIPLGTVAFRLSMMSAFFSAAAGIFVYLAAFRLTRSRSSSLLAQGIFGFCAVIWAQSVIPEVYSLTMFIMAILLYLLILYRERRSDRLAYIIGLVLGFGLTNHVMVITFIPSIIYILGRKSLKVAPFVILPLLLYVHLPLHWDAAFNYGDMTVPANFFRHVTATEYLARTFSFEDLLFPVSFIIFLLEQFSALAGLALIGIYYFHIRRKEFWPLLLIVLINAGLGIKNSAIFTPPHLIPSILVVSLLMGGGARWIFDRTKAGYAAAFLAVAVFIAFTLLTSPEVDRSHDLSAVQYLNHVSQSVRGQSIFIGRSDDDLFPLYYFKYVEGRLPDTLLFFYRNIAPVDGKPISSLSEEEVIMANVRIYNFMFNNLYSYRIYTTLKGHDVESYTQETFPIKEFNQTEIYFTLSKEYLDDGDLYFYR